MWSSTTLELARGWTKQKAVGDRANLRALDTRLDRALFSIADYLGALQKGMDEGDMLYTVTQRILDEIYPAGVLQVAQMTYMDENAEVKAICERLAGDLKADVESANMGVLVEKLTQASQAFDEELKKEKAELVTWDQVRAAQAAGQNRLLQAVAMIVGAYPGGDQAQQRTQLLGPILRQNAAMGEYLRSRRSPQDVDPSTGEVVEEDVVEP